MTFLRIILKATLLTVILFALVDFTGFVMWALSGQKPLDEDVYIGTITTHILQTFVQARTEKPE